MKTALEMLKVFGVGVGVICGGIFGVLLVMCAISATVDKLQIRLPSAPHWLRITGVVIKNVFIVLFCILMCMAVGIGILQK